MPLQLGLKDDGEKRLALRLVGKILSNTLVNRDTFIGVIPKIGCTLEEFEIEFIDGNIVVINVNQPLRRILRVDVLCDGKETNMLLRYEKLPEHCFRFGRLGHVVRDCSVAAENNGPEDYNLMFEPWLKASSRIKSNAFRVSDQ
ncbi:hypothetical protein Dsin_011581 [Dipteronia sinensis]|uniref:Zinc knuckle CX2CX4HX4C domain-containing protein n=1 Tax=Dipteronia sinensis TaxID=43782 RepID=A0AAE0EDR2_9ROSI|nr:hypothetical protein Dsin_011581 [Dipteronia sinensis]